MLRINLLILLVNLALISKTGTLYAQNQDTTELAAGNDRIEVTLSRRDNALLGKGLVNPATGFNWIAPGTAMGAYLFQKDTRIEGFDGQGDFKFLKHSQKGTEQGGLEHVLEWVRADGLGLDWQVRSFPGVSVLEYQACLRNSGAGVIPELKEFGPLSLYLRGDQGDLKVHWVVRNAYKRYEVTLKDLFSVSGGSWNAPDSAGWVAIENVAKKEILFLGVEWESYWRVALCRQGSNVLLECTLERFTHDLAPGAEMTSPRVFLGVSHGDLDDALRDLHDYLRRYVLPPVLPEFPWVTYNIWGTSGDGSTESDILKEIPFVANLGVEVFYVDASWYKGSCKVPGLGDWFSGLGNWHSEDLLKYPRGLAYISQQVHQAGMKFGLWFAPQMVDTSLIGDRIPETWIARRDGGNLVTNPGRANGWGSITQICLGNPEVVEFLKDSIASAVKRYNLDWVKWDGSGLPGLVCNRGDHGHQIGDGHLAAIGGQYQVWQYLHRLYPNIVLEECGYGSRLDYGLARYMRTNWLDDSSGDALPVRKRVINGTYVYPAPYLETWIYKSSEIDNEKDPDILNTTVRSRMLGLFGVGCRIKAVPHERLSLFPPEAVEAIKRNIADYKKYRHLLLEDVYHFPPPSDKPYLGDAIQFCRRDGSESVVMVFQNGNAYEDPNPTPFDDSSLADVVHGKNITATSGDSQWGFIAQGTCNGSGLDFETGLRHRTVLKDMWLGSAGAGAAPHSGTAEGANWIAYAFDKSYPLGKTWVWNWNNEGAGAATGLNHVTIEYSVTGGVDPGEWKKLGEFQFSKATGAPRYPGFNGPDFAGAMAKYVIITVHPLTGDMATSGSWGAGDCGLSEVRFYLDTEKAKKTVQKMVAAQSHSSEPEMQRTIVPRGLKPDVTYTVTSLNTGKSEKETGAKLISEGLKISFAKPGMSEICLIKHDLSD